MVASRYANQPKALWNLPGGRQQPGELFAQTVEREFLEETGLRVRAGELAYVSESYDGQRHFVNVTFNVEVIARSSFGSAPAARFAHGDNGRDHVAAVEWVALDEVRDRIVVGVVREPLIAYLQGVLEVRYMGFPEAGVTIEWPDGSD